MARVVGISLAAGNGCCIFFYWTQNTYLLCLSLADRECSYIPNHQAYLEALPAAPMYERSYMHRDVVTHAVMTPCGTDFLVTASLDGHIKFWKKMPEGVEFVKHYHSHLEPIHDMVVSENTFWIVVDFHISYVEHHQSLATVNLARIVLRGKNN